jgi:hypothetical protein
LIDVTPVEQEAEPSGFKEEKMLLREASSWKTIGVTIDFQLKNIG